MYHLIEFNVPFTADIEVSPKLRLEQVRLRQGARVCVSLIPHVIESPEGPIEVADLCFEDGSLARDVPFEHFRFVEQ